MFKLAIIGRPNVGKSTLFNKLCGHRKAIVHDLPGVTRDIKTTKARLDGLHFEIIDTAGLDDKGSNDIERQMWEKAMQAVEMADGIIFLADASAGATAEDKRFAKLVRKQGKPILLLLNKADKKGARKNKIEFFELGLGEPNLISAEQKLGYYEITDFVRENQAKLGISNDEDDADENYIKMAIIGRPNVGKSTLVNNALGEERFITADVAGTTRDSVEEFFQYKDYKFKIIDTAGLRKKAKVYESLDKAFSGQALENVRFSDVCVLVLDGTQNLEKQDLTLASYANKEGRSVIIAVNKWDIVEDKKQTLKDIQHKLMVSFHQIKEISLLTTSALKQKGVDNLLDEVIKVSELAKTEISTAKLNKWLQEAVAINPPPLSRLKRPMSLKYVTQTGVKPLSFKIFVGGASDVPANYEQYLKNSFSKYFKLSGVPVRINFSKSNNPYQDKDK